MTLNIFRISTSYVLNTFLSIITNQLGVHCYFYYKNTLLINRYPGWLENNIVKNQEKTKPKAKLYMHNTMGDVSLTNISRDTNYFHYFVQYSN